ncbi:MAG: DUF2254 domain-containing protein [Ginsengibacter sp.]
MQQNLKFFFKKLTNKLWFRPLIFCLLSIAAAFLAHLADNSFLVNIAPDIEKSSLEDLLSTISASMLVIAIFAVGSMISAFSAASGTATPRSFKLIVADDVSQNALSVYIGSFIFSIVAAVALKNGYYGEAGYFTLFVVTLIVFALVILTFLKWVERISKLGRLGHTIKKVEEATCNALRQRLQEPYMGGSFISHNMETGTPIYSEQMGYVQHINMERLQRLARNNNATVVLKCIPGTFSSADKPLAYINFSDKSLPAIENEKIIKAFIIDDTRSFLDDPRFGIIALSEIASRALSPGINDPGTAIAIIGSHVRLFTLWAKGKQTDKIEEVKYDRIKVPAISLADMFDDAFRPIARDGASNIEVMLRLQKALITIAYVGNDETKELSMMHSRQAFERAELVIKYKHDLDLLKRECLFNKTNTIS